MSKKATTLKGSHERLGSISAALQKEAKATASAQEDRKRAKEARLTAIQGALRLAGKDKSGKGKGKMVTGEEGGDETDYDVDGEYERLVSDWVPVEDRFDPTSENQPRDDA